MRLRNLVPVLLLSLFGASCGSPPAPVVTPPPAVSSAVVTGPVMSGVSDEPLALDTRVRKGKLANGLTYYVLAHQKPEHRAQVWLAVNAGSVLEDDDQRGLAHFVEHMGFNGTTRFPKQALVDMLEKSGVAFGADLNAYTSFDETVYTLQVPTDDPKLLTGGINILRDWTDSVSFDPVEFEKERGVVLEEWRLGRGASQRIFDKQAPVLFHGSKYAERLTIGKPEIIRGASRETIMRFYKDWYRPDLMAVIAVGDFNPDEVEAQIKTQFATIKPASTSARPRIAVPVPPHAQTLVTVETDPEATQTVVSITTKMPHRPLVSARDYRRAMGEDLYFRMLNGRLDELRRKPNAPFLYAGSGTDKLVRTEDSLSQWATVKEGGFEEGYSALLQEMVRVEKHGFLASELDRAKASMIRSYQENVKQRATENGRGLAQEIVRNFLENEAMPGAEGELALAEKLLPTYTLEELNGLGKTLGAGSRVIAVKGPSTMQKPSEASILALTKEVQSRDVAAYVDTTSNVPLMADKPTPGPVVATKTIPEIGVTEWTLKNGVRVVVKPTDFKNDEVRLSAFAPGGTSLSSDADLPSAKFAAALVAQSGIGPFDATALRKALAGKVAWAGSYVSELEQGINGSAAPSDMETMFQMSHLWFTGIRHDQNAFDSWRTRETESAKNRRQSPEGTFYEDLQTFTTQNNKRRQPVTPEVIAAVNLDKALGFYKDRFADASGFTFILVGNLDLAKTQTLAETYLGSLPSTNRKETWKDPKVEIVKGVAKKKVEKGSEPKSRVELIFHGNETWSRETDNDMRMLGEVLRIRLREILREDMGGVYGVSSSGSVSRRPRPTYAFTVSFGCAPENVDKLEKAVFDEIKAIQSKGIGDDYIAKVKELRKRAHETNLRDNGYWVSELERTYTYNDDPKLILDFDSMVDKITSDRVRAAAKKYLKSSEYVLGELRPAKP